MRDKPRVLRIGTALVLCTVLLASVGLVTRSWWGDPPKVTVIGYFENSNGIFAGDQVRILGVPVGKIDKIEPQPDRVKITFWFDAHYQVPVNASAAILSPSLVTARAIQLTPAYTGGPTMRSSAVIPLERTAVPVEWDDFRKQLEKITQMLKPTEPGGVSTLGAFINTSADNLRGQGPSIRDTVIELSQALSALGDHSGDIFTSIKNLATLVSALQDSTTLMEQLNERFAMVTGLLANDPNEIGNAVTDMNTAFVDMQSFLADNSEALGVTFDKLSGISTAISASLDDIKQALHIAPTTFQNFVNMWQPAQGAMTGAAVFNNFANPISFFCGAIQAASRLNSQQSAKLCVQYLAPILKNRQYNFPPIGLNPFVGASARPNEVTYSEDSLRPDSTPAPPPPSTDAARSAPPPPDGPITPPSTPVATDPAAGLSGMMVPPQ